MSRQHPTVSQGIVSQNLFLFQALGMVGRSFLDSWLPGHGDVGITTGTRTARGRSLGCKRKEVLSVPLGECVVGTPLYFAPRFSHPSTGCGWPQVFCSVFGSLEPTFPSGVWRSCGQIWNASGWEGGALFSAAARFPGAVRAPLLWVLQPTKLFLLWTGRVGNRKRAFTNVT